MPYKMVKSDRDNLLFLWTIMKQHARSLTFTDWSSVATDHDMTKPHAARMRFFRLRKELMADEPDYISKLAQQPKDQPGEKKPAGTRKRTRKTPAKGKGKVIDDEFSDDDEPLKDYIPDSKKQKGMNGGPVIFAQNLTPASFGDDLKQENLKTEGPSVLQWQQEFPMIKTEENAGAGSTDSFGTPAPFIKTEPGISDGWAAIKETCSASTAIKPEPEVKVEDQGVQWLDPIPDNDSGFWALHENNEQRPA